MKRISVDAGERFGRWTVLIEGVSIKYGNRSIVHSNVAAIVELSLILLLQVYDMAKVNHVGV